MCDRRALSVSNNYLYGTTFSGWATLLKENGYRVSPCYAHRAAALTAVSLLNSRYKRIEDRLYGESIEQTTISEAPLFILGHWRTGTTYLHYLLATDTELFTYPNTLQALNPHTFLTTEDRIKTTLARMIGTKRIQDNVPLGVDLPQEDEVALAITSHRSPYIAMSFPRHEGVYSRYMSFKDSSDKDKKQWMRAFVWFLKKLTYKANKAIVLKSPPHTARIPIILDMFPDAKFVHISRDPCRIVQSMRHTMTSVLPYLYLQKPTRHDIDQIAIARFCEMYKSFFEARHLIPEKNYVETRFEDLEQQPVSELRRIYRALSMRWNSSLEKKLDSYVTTFMDYKQNVYKPLSLELERSVRKALSQYCETWGYAR